MQITKIFSREDTKGKVSFRETVDKKKMKDKSPINELWPFCFILEDIKIKKCKNSHFCFFFLSERSQFKAERVWELDVEEDSAWKFDTSRVLLRERRGLCYSVGRDIAELERGSVKGRVNFSHASSSSSAHSLDSFQTFPLPPSYAH